MQKIHTCLWFDGQAEEAAQFYATIFKTAKIGKIARYGKDQPGLEGTALTVEFQLDGVDFTGLNGGPAYKFTPAMSLVIDCTDQAEVDYHWDKLLQGGKPDQCGWLTDKFGVSWQVVPRRLTELAADPDREKAGRVIQAMMQMVKLDVAKLEAAAAG